LPEEMIPKHFRKTHEFLLSLRDKMFAHADVDWADPTGEAVLNRITGHRAGDCPGPGQGRCQRGGQLSAPGGRGPGGLPGD
jgi:hypothetical protein